MKEKDLYIPCTWHNRYPLFTQRLLYIPDYYQNHQEFYSEEYQKFLVEKEQLVVEFCSGNGQWIMKQALEHPNKNFIAVEKKFHRARKIWKKIHNDQIVNLIVVLGTGQDFSSYYLPTSSVSQMYINFPDPWPKKKHAKNRILQTSFLDQIYPLLVSKGFVFMASDHKEYIESTLKLFLQSSSWAPCFTSPYYVTQMPDYGTSYFASLFHKQNLPIYYIKFAKKC
jgi:tRNA (guanine-N7-)-methyltransferase